jgi:hypothetical protein
MRLVKEKMFIYKKIPKLDVVGSMPISRSSEELALKNTGGSVGKVIN